MARSRWIYIDGVAINAEDDAALARARGHSAATGRTVSIMPDLPEFVSPIDNQVYSGRAGLREHCQKHNVVPTADLAGLPPKPTRWEPVPSRREVEARKQQIAQIVNHYER